MSKTPTVNGKVVHSSLRLFSQDDLDFPNSDSRLGICVRIGYSKSHECNMANVYFESPIVTSPGKGEIIEIDEVEGYIRTKAIEISGQCKKLANELLLHAERLSNLSFEDDNKLIEGLSDGLIEESDNESTSLTVLDDTQTYVLNRKKERERVYESKTDKGVDKTSTSKINKISEAGKLSLAEIVRRRSTMKQE